MLLGHSVLLFSRESEGGEEVEVRIVEIATRTRYCIAKGKRDEKDEGSTYVF